MKTVVAQRFLCEDVENIYHLTFRQGRNNIFITASHLRNICVSTQNRFLQMSRNFVMSSKIISKI